MKKVIFSVLLSFLVMGATAQTFHQPTRKTATAYTDTTTTYKYATNDGKTYKVYKSSRGAYYIWRVSKKGKLYKNYLPKEVQIAMGRKYDK